MAVVLTIAELNDGSLQSVGTESYPDSPWSGTPIVFMRKARNGTDVTTDPGSDPISGQKMAVGGFMGEAPGAHVLRLFQSWAEFLPEKGFQVYSNEELVSASLRLSLFGSQYNVSGDDSLQGWSSPTTFPLGSGSWRDMEPLRDNFLYDYEYYQIQLDPSTANLLEAGGEQFLLNVKANLTAGVAQQELFTTFTSLRDFPGGTTFRLLWINPANREIETNRKPTVILRTQKRHALNAVGGSSIQLSDGTAVFLRNDLAGGVRLYYQRPHQTSPTLIHKLPTTVGEHSQYYQVGAGYQTFSITRDDADNIYVVGMRGALQGNHNSGVKYWNVNGYKNLGNFSWQYWTPTTMGDNTLGTYQTHRALPNNFQACWFPNSDRSSLGQLVVFHSHRDGQWGKNQLGISNMNLDYLFGGGTRYAYSKYADILSTGATWRPMNSSGTGLDAIADGSEIRVASFIQAGNGSDLERSAVGKASVPTAQASLGTPSFVSGSFSTNSPHDPDAKIRLPHMGDSPNYYAIARHGHIGVYLKSNDTIFQQIDLTQQGLTGFPSREVLQRSQAWDIVRDSVFTNWLWVYYRDANNSRLIRKVRWNLFTNELDASFQFTPTPLGPSGSSIESIRVPRQKINTKCVIVDVAMQDGGGAPVALISLRDTSMNTAPGPVTNIGIGSYNATVAKTVTFQYNDADGGDYPTSAQIQVRRVSTGATVYDSGKVAPTQVSGAQYQRVIPSNTLSNDTSYQMRIRAYDSVDAEGQWSAWVAFTTSGTGGSVVITQPATDLESLASKSLLIKWTYTNTNPAITQNGYRVRVYNDTSNVLHSDTALVSSTATERQLTNLWSDVRYRIEVTVLDSNGQTSGAGIRLVLPDYDNPLAPTITTEKQSGFIRVRCTNPPAIGEAPATRANQIARKEFGAADSTFKVIGLCAPSGTFDDYTVASKQQYVYKARAIAAGYGAEEPGNPGNPGGGGIGEDGITAASLLNWGTPNATWSDEFGYTGAPNPAKWNNAPVEGMDGHNGNGRRVAYCTTVGNGMMTLHGYPNGDTGWVQAKRDRQYGRWEVRSRSRNIGTTGGKYHVLHIIWPQEPPYDWPVRGEYDFVEYTDPDAQNAEAYIHYPHPSNVAIQQEHNIKNGVDMTQFHNFAFEWTENHVKCWVDGELWYTESGGAIPGTRSAIQAMPIGHYVAQLDNFTGDGGLREATFDIAFYREYDF